MKKRTKIVYCTYFEDEDCPKESIIVSVFASNKIVCSSCLKKGKMDNDQRKTDSCKEKRKNTTIKKYGVENVSNMNGVSVKKNKTNLERYGGIGFSSEKLKDKTKNTMNERYDSYNIMKTEYGKRKFSENCLQKYGVTNPMKLKENSRKVSEKLKGRKSHLEGKKYEDIYGEEYSMKLKEKKREKVLKNFLPKLQNMLLQLNLELVDSPYISSRYLHTFRCKICNTEFKKDWNSIRQGYKCKKCKK